MPSNESAPCAASPPDASAPFESELERARSLYRRGCHDHALDLLRALDLRRRLERVPERQLVRTLFYLGEVELVLGRREEARAIFESLLNLVPNASPNLLEHDPDAIDLFDGVKASRPPPPPQEPAPPPTPPQFSNRDLPARGALTYAPYGVGHLLLGDKRRALGYGGAQIALGSTMIVTHQIFDRQFPSGGPAEGPGELRRATLLRSLNYGALLGLLSTYAVSQLDATRRWRKSQRERKLEEWSRAQEARSSVPLPLPPLAVSEGRRSKP
ncbi:MAG: hypothetical protein EA397_14090 [Deltaproteobacteria bacterium]|nr:MAG: hypothetical protein EA397_14090 [Deltaproteobacteria bacterium]